ncbi:hypothetical protein ACLB2K_018353 [Fragaria x ananassa]
MDVFVIVATLVVKCSFAACLTAPGGYHSEEGSPDQGYVVLAGDYALTLFYILTVVAMVCSSSFLPSHLLRLIQASPRWKHFGYPQAVLLFFSLLAMLQEDEQLAGALQDSLNAESPPRYGNGIGNAYPPPTGGTILRPRGAMAPP